MFSPITRFIPMPKIVAMLMALAVIAVAASSARADVPATVTTFGSEAAGSYTTQCVTGWQYGVYGAHGAWGNFIDGCTVAQQCPPHWGTCHVYDKSYIETQERTGNRVTLNSRLRFHSTFIDSSCAGTDSCLIPIDGSRFLRGGDFASVQCNGVRDDNIPDPEQTLARVVCLIQVARTR